ncbi:MAG TPA: hypothetical protein VEV81_11950 [Pyrinomonadaceae bacterium]|nr:hypothetical protein [Pyrinomonadaceae bacterium]
MKKTTILIATILLSVAAASAQTAGKAEPAGRSREGEKSVAPGQRRAGGRASLVVKVGPSTTYLKNGLNFDQVVRLLGEPVSVSEARNGEQHVVTCRFARSGGRVLVAEFEDGLLVGSRTESHESLVQNRETQRK